MLVHLFFNSKIWPTTIKTVAGNDEQEDIKEIMENQDMDADQAERVRDVMEECVAWMKMKQWKLRNNVVKQNRNVLVGNLPLLIQLARIDSSSNRLIPRLKMGSNRLVDGSISVLEAPPKQVIQGYIMEKSHVY